MSCKSITISLIPLALFLFSNTDPARDDDGDRLRCGRNCLVGGVAARRHDDDSVAGAARGGQHPEGGRYPRVATETL